MISPASVQEKHITGEELLEMGDIGPAELIDGKIVLMSPTSGEHGYFEQTLSSKLDQFVRARKLGWVLSGEVGIYIRRNPDRIRAADVAVVSREHSPLRALRGYLTFAPILVIEIVSPSDRWDDIRQKIEDYFSIGVERVWICEPELQDILIFRSPLEFTKIQSNEVLHGEGILNGFELRLTELFEIE
ncbi:MAG TPA: Uma2 family endonuclease [Anaerolineae bacterium]|nr:Uma2 family endonuclease [Anaerolineae bacterium]